MHSTIFEPAFESNYGYLFYIYLSTRHGTLTLHLIYSSACTYSMQSKKTPFLHKTKKPIASLDKSIWKTAVNKNPFLFFNKFYYTIT